MKKRAGLGYLTKEGFRNVWVNRLMSIASIAVLMSCLVMIGSAFMVLVNVEKVMTEIESQNVVMVYLEDDVSQEQIDTVKQEMIKLQYVGNIEFVDKDTAYQAELKELGSAATYFEGYENPLPDMFKVSVTDMNKFDTTVDELKQIDNVFSIRDNRDIATTLAQIRQVVTYISVGIIAVLLIISLFIIANTVRITMFTRRLEINIMKSVGATNWFIRWPFLIEGMLLGALSGLISLGAVAGIYRLLAPTVSTMFTLFSKDFALVPFRSYILYLLAAFIVIGVMSGGIGSIISIQKYLRERGGVVYDEAE